MANLNPNWTGEETQAVTPVLDPQAVSETESTLVAHAAKLQFPPIKANAGIRQEAGAKRIYYWDRLTNELRFLLVAHPAAYPRAPQDGADLGALADGQVLAVRVVNQAQNFTDRAGLGVLLREGILGERTLAIAQFIITEYQTQEAAGKVDPELAVVYNGVLPLYNQLMARSQDGKVTAKNLRAEGGAETDFWKQQATSLEQRLNAAEAQVAELLKAQAQDQAGQPPATVSPGTLPASKSARKTPRG